MVISTEIIAFVLLVHLEDLSGQNLVVVNKTKHNQNQRPGSVPSLKSPPKDMEQTCFHLCLGQVLS